jgi:hypothetical protein
MTSPEFMGYLIVGLAALLTLLTGLSTFVSKPVNELNRLVTMLNARLEGIEEDVKEVQKAVREQESHDRGSHTRIWTKFNSQDETLFEHEKRIGRLEHRNNKEG